MNPIDCIFFWQGGVVTEDLAKLLSYALDQPYAEADLFRSNPDLRTMKEELAIGAISFDEFCNSLSEISKTNLTPLEVQNLISKKATIDPDLIAVAKEFGDQYDLRIISDFPPELQKTVIENNDLKAIFPPDKSILCSDINLTQLTPDIFFHSTNISRHPMENCILVDSNSARAVAAVRSGLSSIIYLDVPRFRRELVLREMLPPSQIDYQPKIL